MRATLLGVVLIAATGTAILAANFFTNAQDRQIDPEHPSNTALPLKVDTVLTPGRVAISPTELSLAVSQKLLPPDAKSLLEVPSQLRHGNFVWNEKGVAAGRIVIWVDLRRQMISAFRNGHEIGTAVIVYGAQEKSSPEGVFEILRKSSDYHSRTYDAPMPYSLFITNDGVALHGSPMSKSRASNGCIGLPVEFAQKLFEAAKVGDVITILKSDANPTV